MKSPSTLPQPRRLTRQSWNDYAAYPVKKVVAVWIDAHVSASALLTNPPSSLPTLRFGVGQLQCLHGQHCIRIGRELLPPGDRWWSVDIYLEDISDELRTSLLEEYSNEKPPSDGEVYWKIRQYDSEHNARFRKRWLSRLSANKEKRLKALLAHDEFRDAFDELLAVPGLWGGEPRIGSLGKLIAAKCDEEIVSYLNFIREFWFSIVDGVPAALMRIDQRTVEKLQLHAPGVSQEDSRTVQGLVLSG
ncbi:hypothetical protein KXW62_003601 [Aspergillus fumigatus]|nr:hypothetical protein KXW62_003601 [Aspergillus fumigatus]